MAQYRRAVSGVCPTCKDLLSVAEGVQDDSESFVCWISIDAPPPHRPQSADSETESHLTHLAKVRDNFRARARRVISGAGSGRNNLPGH